MPLAVSVEITGTRVAREKLEDYPRKVQKGLQDALDEYSFLIQREAQERAPVDTGFLRSSIIVEDEDKWTRIITATASYAGFVEFGTRYTPAQPYLVPAALSYRRQFQQRCREIMADAA